MTGLEWDENDFLYCLEVNPIVEDDGLEFHYEVEKNGLVVSVSVIPYRSSVAFSLSQEGEEVPITSFSLLVSGGVSYEKDKRGEHLVFSQCMFVTDPYDDEPLQQIENRSNTFDLTVELFIKPHIRIKFN